MLKKLLTVGVFFLLFSLTTLPIVSSEESYNKNVFYWGFILKKNTETVMYSWTHPLNNSWEIVFDFYYYVFGIGRHDIIVEFNYNMTVLDIDTNGTKGITGVVTFNDELYLYQPSRNPITKLESSAWNMTSRIWNFIEGYWTATIESNGKIVYEKDYYLEWPGR